MQNFKGLVVVERVLSQLENGCIFSGRRDDGQLLRVKFASRDTQPLPGDWFHVEGELVSHRDRFGTLVPQVDSKVMQRSIEKGALLRPWLERHANIGAARAARLVEAFGSDLPEVLADVRRLSEVAAVVEPSKPTLAAKITAQLFSAVAVQAGADAMREEEVKFLAHLEKLGIQESRAANQLWRFMMGRDAIARLQRNPYAVASLVEWKVADRIGQRLLRSANPGADLVAHPERLMGAVTSAWKEVLADGDTASTQERMEALLAARNAPAHPTLDLAEERALLRRSGPLLRAPGAAWLEDQVATALWSMESQTPTIAIPTGDQLDRLVFEAETSVGLRLTDEQHLAVMKLLTSPVAALQGGAGVGKTTVMKVLASAWEYMGGDVVMGALAGKAALTLSRGASSPGRPRLAYTVARLIGMLERQRAHDDAATRSGPASDLGFTAKTLLIIDEAGMLDTPSLNRLLRLLPAGARILFAGDEGQLPPVGIGKIFHDLVAEGSRVSRLTKVLRQAEDSQIPKIAASVRNGDVPDLDAWAGEKKGVYLVRPDQLLAVQRQLRPLGELMVVAAKRSTVDTINESESCILRKPHTPVRRLGPLATVAVGDPIVMTVNRYGDGLFNGLLGVVTDLAEDGVWIHWDGEDSPRSLPKEAEGDVELAYAITCHKAQGSSCLAVLIAVERSPLVTREWLYTAITRSRELVLLAGTAEDFVRAVERRTSRTTGFKLPTKRVRRDEMCDAQSNAE